MNSVDFAGITDLLASFSSRHQPQEPVAPPRETPQDLLSQLMHLSRASGREGKEEPEEYEPSTPDDNTTILSRPPGSAVSPAFLENANAKFIRDNVQLMHERAESERKWRIADDLLRKCNGAYEELQRGRAEDLKVIHQLEREVKDLKYLISRPLPPPSSSSFSSSSKGWR